jgi:hypothetical protein
MYSSPSFYFYYAYIMTNRSKTLYTGVTGNLEKRVFEHKQGIKGNSLRATRSTGWGYPLCDRSRETDQRIYTNQENGIDCVHESRVERPE